jgi:hypothetical protein
LILFSDELIASINLAVVLLARRKTTATATSIPTAKSTEEETSGEVLGHLRPQIQTWAKQIQVYFIFLLQYSPKTNQRVV